MLYTLRQAELAPPALPGRRVPEDGHPPPGARDGPAPARQAGQRRDLLRARRRLPRLPRRAPAPARRRHRRPRGRASSASTRASPATRSASARASAPSAASASSRRSTRSCNLITIGDDDDLLRAPPGRRASRAGSKTARPRPSSRRRSRCATRVAPVAGHRASQRRSASRSSSSARMRAVTPGQAAVFYDGERVIGGGVISRAFK